MKEESVIVPSFDGNFSLAQIIEDAAGGKAREGFSGHPMTIYRVCEERKESPQEETKDGSRITRDGSRIPGDKEIERYTRIRVKNIEYD